MPNPIIYRCGNDCGQWSGMTLTGGRAQLVNGVACVAFDAPPGYASRPALTIERHADLAAMVAQAQKPAATAQEPNTPRITEAPARKRRGRPPALESTLRQINLKIPPAMWTRFEQRRTLKGLTQRAAVWEAIAAWNEKDSG